jgi:two-component system NtrC family response regulator
MAEILVVDNEQRMCKIIKAGLEMEEHHVDMVFTGEDALERIRESEKYEIVITDLRMSGIDGLQVLENAKQMRSKIEVILITAFASQQTAIEAMQLGAYDYLIKPFEMEELSLRIKRIIEHKNLEAENRKLRAEKETGTAGNLVGKSKKMREIYDLIHRVAESDATVLVRGESGTGKELVAEAIHQQSNRSADPFITVNCAAVPENLLESELFGYEKGAFTGATKRKIGLLELADKGTLFMDEIGDMPLGLQAKLLRVLQNKEVIRVGGTEKIIVDARIISATNRELEPMIEEGTFRSDLYYRLNIFPIQVPPLREHKEDIPELVQHFLDQLSHKGITSSARRLLIEYNWPGNVRELINVLERAVIVADTTIDIEHLPAELVHISPSERLFQIPDEGISLDQFEHTLIESALQKTNGNKTHAAQLLGVTRRRLYSLMQKFKLD